MGGLQVGHLGVGILEKQHIHGKHEDSNDRIGPEEFFLFAPGENVMKWFIPDQGACQVDKSHAAGQEECKLHGFITFPEIAVYG